MADKPQKKYEYKRATITYDGKRYTARGKTQREADRRLREKISALQRMDGGITSSITVREWSDIWLETYIRPKVREPGKKKMTGTMQESSFQSKKQMVEQYILPAVGNVKLHNVTPAMLQKIINEDPFKSYSHVQKLRIATKQMFKQAWMERRIIFDPAANLEMPATEKNGHRILTENERTTFYQAAQKNRHGLLFRFLLATGIRPNELAALQVGDINLAEKTVHITTALEAGSNVIAPPKTEAGIRYTIINDTNDPQIAEDIRRHIEGKTDSDFVFTKKDGGMMTRMAVSSYWRSFTRDWDLLLGAEHTPSGHIYDPADLAYNGTPLYPDPKNPAVPRNGHKLADDLVPYCLRHTFGTDLVRSGIPLTTIQYVMGHSDIAVTANVYIEKDKSDAIQALNTLHAAVTKV